MHSKRALNTEKILLNNWRPYFWIALLACIVFGKSIFFDFTYSDDDYYVLSNHKFNHDVSNVINAFQKNYTATYYRPVVLLSLIFDAQIGKTSAWIYHLTNLFIHILVSMLFFRLLIMFDFSRLKSIFIALLFTIHPLVTQSVTWIMGRNDSLVTLFILISFLSFLKSFNTKKISFIILHFIFYALAIFTKEIAIVFPIICLLYAIFISEEKIDIKFSSLVVLGWIIITAVWYFLRASAIANVTDPGITGIESFIQNIATIPAIIGKTFLPIHLSPLASFENVSIITGGIVVLIFLIHLFMNSNARNNRILFWSLWFILFLIPTLFFRLRSANDLFDYLECRAYLPMIGLLFLIPELIQTLKIRLNRNAMLVLGCSIIALFSIRSFIYSDAYKDRMNYFTAASQTSPNKALIHYNLAKAYSATNDLSNAKLQLEKSKSLNPNRADTFVDLAEIYYKEGNTKVAKELNLHALQLNPRHPLACSNLGVILNHEGKFDDAVKMWLRAIEIDKDFAIGYENLFKFYFTRQKFEVAITFVQMKKMNGIELPTDAAKSFAFYYSRYMGRASYFNNALTNAELYFQKAIEINPNSSDAWIDLGALYFSKGLIDTAIAIHKKAIQLDPHNVTAYANLGTAFKNLNRIEEAVPMWRLAVAYDSNAIVPLQNLLQYYYDRKKYPEAIPIAEKLVRKGIQLPDQIRMSELYKK